MAYLNYFKEGLFKCPNCGLSTVGFLADINGYKCSNCGQADVRRTRREDKKKRLKSRVK